MDTEYSFKNLPEINLDLQLEASMAGRLDLDALREAIAEDLGELLHVLGIPGEPRVHIASAPQSNESAPGFLHVTINDQPCRWAAETLFRGYHYLTGEVLDGTPVPSCVLEALKTLTPEQTSALIELLCVEAIKGSPATLLTADSVRAYQTALLDNTDKASLFDTPGLQSLLASVLNLGISIADRATVAQILMDGFTDQRSPTEIAEDLIVGLRPDVIEVQIPHDYLKQVTLNVPESERGNFAMMRDGLFYELGMRFPAIRFEPTENLQHQSIRIKINHLTTLPVRGLRADECLASDTPDRLRLLNIDGRAAINPANLSLCSIINNQDVGLAEKARLTTWSQLGYLILAISAELRTHAACFLDRRAVEALLSDLEWSYQQLVEATRELVSPEAMTGSWRLLLAEEISIRNMRRILQSMIEFHLDNSKYDILDLNLIELYPPSNEWMNAPINLTSFLRIKMKRYIGHKYARDGNVLVVYLLDPEIERLLANPQMMAADAHPARLDPRDRDRILAAVRAELGSLPPTAQLPVVLTTCSVRPIFRELIAPEFPRLAVMCYQELSPDLNIQTIAELSPVSSIQTIARIGLS